MYPGIARRAPVTGVAAPPHREATNTAPTTRAAMTLRGVQYSPDRLWGSLPVEEVEGHDPDPAYDVRPIEGLGRAPIRSERLGLGLSREIRDRLLTRPSSVVSAASNTTTTTTADDMQSAATLSAAASSFDASSLLPLAILGGLLFLMKR